MQAKISVFFFCIISTKMMEDKLIVTSLFLNLNLTFYLQIKVFSMFFNYSLSDQLNALCVLLIFTIFVPYFFTLIPKLRVTQISLFIFY